MKVLVLGGTRYVGLALVKKLQSSKLITKIYSLSRQENKFNLQYHYIVDKKEKKVLQAIYNKIKPDIIIDLICFSKQDSEEILNLKRNGFLKYVKHYIIISSFFVYNYFPLQKFKEKKLDLNSREDIISDNYTKNKIEMEIVLSSSEFFKNISIVRFPYIFSYDDYTNRFQSLCELAIRKKASNKKNKFKFSMISKDSAAEALMSILAEKPLGIVDPCNPGCANIDEILKKIKNLNYNQEKKINNLKLKEPYILEKDLCIETDKVFIKKKLFEAIEEEAKKYFKFNLHRL